MITMPLCFPLPAKKKKQKTQGDLKKTLELEP